MNDHETVSLASPRLEHFTEQARQYPPLKTAVVVAGDVDILLAPDLNAANILAKDLEYLAGATLAGIVVGTTVPIMLPSRSDPPMAPLARLAAALVVIMHNRTAQPAAGSPS